MKKEWVLTQEAFDALLGWLDADREAAARKYETIRLRLVKIFVCRRCAEAEDLADETINRVAAKLPEIAGDYVGEPAPFFYGVAHRVHQEYERRMRRIDPDIPVETAGPPTEPGPDPLSEDIEVEYECLEHCLERLPSNNRLLVLEYYQQQKQAKIDNHKRLAGELGIAVNALRIRAHRIRRALKACVHGCVQQQLAH